MLATNMEFPADGRRMSKTHLEPVSIAYLFTVALLSNKKDDINVAP